MLKWVYIEVVQGVVEDVGDHCWRRARVSCNGGQSVEYFQRLTVDVLFAILGDGGSTQPFTVICAKSCRRKTVAIKHAQAPQILSIRLLLPSILLQWSCASAVADIHRPMGKP